MSMVRSCSAPRPGLPSPIVASSHCTRATQGTGGARTSVSSGYQYPAEWAEVASSHCTRATQGAGGGRTPISSGVGGSTYPGVGGGSGSPGRAQQGGKAGARCREAAQGCCCRTLLPSSHHHDRHHRARGGRQEDLRRTLGLLHAQRPLLDARDDLHAAGNGLHSAAGSMEDAVAARCGVWERRQGGRGGQRVAGPAHRCAVSKLDDCGRGTSGSPRGVRISLSLPLSTSRSPPPSSPPLVAHRRQELERALHGEPLERVREGRSDERPVAEDGRKVGVGGLRHEPGLVHKHSLRAWKGWVERVGVERGQRCAAQCVEERLGRRISPDCRGRTPARLPHTHLSVHPSRARPAPGARLVEPHALRVRRRQRVGQVVGGLQAGEESGLGGHGRRAHAPPLEQLCGARAGRAGGGAPRQPAVGQTRPATMQWSPAPTCAAPPPDCPHPSRARATRGCPRACHTPRSRKCCPGTRRWPAQSRRARRTART